jgi:lipopolysaccharide export LptBFGC system permease protein LptF
MNLATRHFGFSLYGRKLIGQTILRVCLLVLLAEGIYLSQRLIAILNILLDQRVSLVSLAPLLAWAAPELHLGLPLIVLIAVYWVVLRSRERLEFVALASGGQSIVLLLRTTAFLSLLALTADLIVSGVVSPYAKFSFRRDQEIVRYDAFRGGSAPGRFEFFTN